MSDDRNRRARVRGTAEYGGRLRSPFERQSPRQGVGPVRGLEAHRRSVQKHMKSDSPHRWDSSEHHEPPSVKWEDA